MAISDRFKKRAEEISKSRGELAMERATEKVKQLMESEQFKLSALALPESGMCVDAIIATTVSSTVSPVSTYEDTLRAKGFRKAEIRSVTERLYVLYFVGLDKSATDDTVYLYDDIKEAVASYVYEHQEIYNSLNPDTL